MIILWIISFNAKFIFDGDYTVNDVIDESRIGFVCGKPLELFNAINIALNDVKSNTVLFVENNFSDSEYIIKIIKECEIFDEVLEFPKCDDVIGRSFFSKIKSIFLPKIFIKKICKSNYKKYYYESLFVSSVNYFSRIVVFANDYNRLIEFEEGLGNYVEDVFDEKMLSRSAKLLNFVLNGKLVFKPCIAYLNRPDLYKNKDSKSVYGIKPLDDDNVAVKYLNKVFIKDTNSPYENKKIFFLSQAVDDNAEQIQIIEYKMLDSLSDMENELIVRYHPRNTLTKSDRYYFDDVNNIWELECEKYVDNNSILISAFSTAMIMPIMMKGVKPYIIFTFEKLKKLYPKYVEDDVKKIVDLAKEVYGEENDKVIVLKEADDLSDCIYKIRNCN